MPLIPLIPSPIFKPHLLAQVYASRKTATRRIVALPRWAEPGTIEESFAGPVACAKVSGCFREILPPHGDIGARWYMREGIAKDGDGIKYRLDSEAHPDASWCWQRSTLPSIHMPRGMARRFAMVSGLRAEPLQDINEADAIAEGVAPVGHNMWRNYLVPDEANDGHGYCTTAVESFRTLWDSINAERGFAWSDNPLVWAYSFGLISREQARVEA